MNFKRVTQIITSFILAGTVTAAVFHIDRERVRFHETVEALQWAKQIAAETDGMAFAARAKGETDPIGWATGLLAQGVEPRIMQVTKIHLDYTPETPEIFETKLEEQVFEFSKVLTPEDGMGVKIKIRLDYPGFLGTHTRLESDIRLAALFTMSFFLAFFSTSGVFGLARKGDPFLKPLVLAWASEAKSLLTQLGMHIREMVREATLLTRAVGKSRDTVSSLRENIHARINEIHQARKVFSDAKALTAEAEKTALSIAIEANRLGPDGNRVAELAQSLHSAVKRLLQINQSAETSIIRVQQELEPWATDADVSFHAYDDVFRASESLNASIRKTTQALLGQAKLIQNLNLKVTDDRNEHRLELPVQNPVQGDEPKLFSQPFPPLKSDLESSEDVPVSPIKKPRKKREITKKTA